jgi:hypothetical protein
VAGFPIPPTCELTTLIIFGEEHKLWRSTFWNVTSSLLGQNILLRIQWVQGALSLWVKRPGREADHSAPSSAEVKECVELYLHSPNMPSWCGVRLKRQRGNFAFTFTVFSNALNLSFPQDIKLRRLSAGLQCRSYSRLSSTYDSVTTAPFVRTVCTKQRWDTPITVPDIDSRLKEKFALLPLSVKCVC